MIYGSGRYGPLHVLVLVWSSSDALTWSRESASAPWTGRHAIGYATTSTSIIICGGSTHNSWSTAYVSNDVWASTNYGSTWTRKLAAAGWKARSFPALTVLNDILYLTGGYQFGGGVSYNDLWKTTDSGATWTQIAATRPV